LSLQKYREHGIPPKIFSLTLHPVAEGDYFNSHQEVTMRHLSVATFLVIFALSLSFYQCGKQGSKPFVTFPTGSSKVWPDTSVSVKVGSYTVEATLRKGTIFVSIPDNFGKAWTSWRWSVHVAQTDQAQPTRVDGATSALSGAGGGGDRDRDGVPDNQDWCPDDSGSAANNGCPPGEEGVPPIVWNDSHASGASGQPLVWVDILRMSDQEESLTLSLGYYLVSSKK